MKFEKEYTIAFGGLYENKEYSYDFKVNDDFFINKNNPQVLGGNVDVVVGLIKKSDGLFLDIQVSGFLKVICNRCLDSFNQEIKFRDSIVVNFSDYTNFDTNEPFVLLDKSSNEINVSQFIYEFCDFALPICCKHPIDKNGNSDCDINMLKLIDKYNKEKVVIDTRWEKLKQFLN